MKFNAVRTGALVLALAAGAVSMSGSAYAMGCLPQNLDVNANATLSSGAASTDDNWAVYHQMVNGNRCDTGAQVNVSENGQVLNYAAQPSSVSTPVTDELNTFAAQDTVD